MSNYKEIPFEVKHETIRQWTEFKMAVPWGHISGKWWGPKDIRPILALHGWQDNAGTFDTLMPLLPTHLGFLAVDLPGHGLSSHLPEGMVYHTVDYVKLVLMIIKQMKWDKVSILGHSMGGFVGLWFAAMFPDKIDLLITIDSLKPLPPPKEHFWGFCRGLISKTMLCDENSANGQEPPSYTYTECIERLYVGAESIDRSKCPFILARNLKESAKYPGKFYFSRDARLKYMNDGLWPHEHYMVLAAHMRIPYLFIDASDAAPKETPKNFNELISSFKKNSLFQYEEVNGRHHVHLNEPEKVSGIISSFLMKHRILLHQQSKL